MAEGSDAQGEEVRPEGAQSHDAGVPARLAELMGRGWGGVEDPGAREPHPVAPYAAKRRARLSQLFPGEVLVVPTGGLVVRENDTDYPFRAGSDYAWLVGDLEPDGVLVLTPRPDAEGGGHRAVVHVPPRAARGEGGLEFFTDRRYGELWVGPRRGLAEVAAAFDVETAPLADLPAALDVEAPVRVLRGVDPRVDALVGARPRADAALRTALSELRLVKDEREVALLEEACAATARGFEDVVRELGAATAYPNGERWLEGTFWRRSRLEGNDVGYGSIVAGGAHATTLHWTRDDGPVREGDLLLLDMGVESRELYTADVTRTLPVSGSFTEAQRRVYEVVWRAQQAGIAAVRPGAGFLDPHRAAMRVVTEALVEWGLLSGDVDELLRDQLHRRWTLHGTSHHLGLDVHDCAHAREDHYRQGALEAGMVLTVEPGLYVQVDDELAPPELRGIGVRIEDDVLVTPDGARVLSAALPTAPDEVEAWVRSLRG